jgi:integrase/recombinase XerD
MESTEFEKFLVVRKGLNPVTVKGHLNAIKRISRSCELTKESAENFIFSLYQSNFSYHYKVNSAKSIEYWFEFNGQDVKFARQRKPKPIIKQTLSEAEITRLLFVCNNIREKAIIATLAYSGIRPKELTNLCLQDIDFGNNEVHVLEGKGLKDGVIYISAACVKILMEYLIKFPRNPQDLLFKTADNLRPFNTNCLRKLVKVLSARSKMTKRIYPYIFRHSLATSMINRGADLLTVMKQLRHSQIETTLLYIHSFGYSPKNEYERFAPNYL